MHKSLPFMALMKQRKKHSHFMPTWMHSTAAITSASCSVPLCAATMTQTSTKTCHNRLPRKRRRYLSELHLMLMIFIVYSSLCLRMGPLEAVAASALQDYGSVTAKGDNVYMVATNDKSNGSTDDDLGNAFPFEMAAEEQEEAFEGEGFGDATHDAGDGNVPLMPNVMKEHDATEDIEMVRPLENMRHYKSRLAKKQNLGLKDIKPALQTEQDVLLVNRRLRYQQIQNALREPVNQQLLKQQKPQHHQQHPHHHHHEHRYHHVHHVGKHEDMKLFKNRHHLDHLRHRGSNLYSIANATTATSTLPSSTMVTPTTTARPRYFDRDGLYTNPLTWMPSTQGPLNLEQNEPRTETSLSTIRYYNDDDMEIEARESNMEGNEKEFKRISLSLDANKESTGKRELLGTSTFENDNDDYSYEDDEDGDEEKNSAPTLAATAKSNVKRYTNPSKASYRTYFGSNKRQHNAKHAFDSDIADYDGHNDERPSHSADDDDDFSDEKWNKIEHEHYRKQLQHQRAMQALRSRRPSAPSISQLDITQNSVSKNSKIIAASGASVKAVTSAKRQILNDDDSDNIYSRYYVPGSVTRRKEDELGSPTAMLESRRQYAMQQRQNKALASAHHRRIVKEGSCRLPQPRVERIRRDSWKIYTPHCTILHRCADDTGCCPTERQTCAPKRTKNVDLYFFVISLNETQGSIEHLAFVNHTECHCVDKSKQKPPEYVTDDGASDLSSNNIPYLRRATILNCNCPNLYEKILQEDGFCRCDCSSGNMGCDWLKRGMEHFSMNDRKCILEGRCKLPTCEYGSYIKKHGRCPRREERQLSVDAVDW